MAQAGVVPTLDLPAGSKVLAEDVPRVLKVLGHASLEEAGWRQIGKSALLIPVEGHRSGLVDAYLLKLAFLTGREWPPSAQFVNPATLSYDVNADASHLPDVNTGQLQVHKDYSFDGQKGQLICCSVTLEFYQVRHSVEPQHVWQSGSTFLATLDIIESSLRSPNYKGRMS